MSEELKPCPFCGGKAKLVATSYGDCYVIYCTKCYTKQNYFINKNKAITAWNTRKPMEDITDRINNEMALEWDNEESMYNLGLKKALEIVQKGGAE